MKKTRTGTPRRTANKNRKAPTRWTTWVLIVTCGLMFASGFFFAGRQHFSSMDYGMKNSRLRRQIDELEAEKRRLLLAREVSLSPAEIKKAVRKVGLVDPSQNTGEMAQVVNSTKDKAVPADAPPMKPMIIKTAAVSPVRTAAPDPNLATAKLIKPAKSKPRAE